MKNRYLYGKKINIKEEDKHTIYTMEDKTGKGEMRRCRIVPGIELIFNDFHMENCMSKYDYDKKMIAIDFCRIGRVEWEIKEAKHRYLGEGDFQISTLEHNAVRFGFPLNHYHGVTIYIFIEQTNKSLKKLLKEFSIDLDKLYDKFNIIEEPLIFRAENYIKLLLSQLYEMKYKNDEDYYRIKSIELLTYLKFLNIENQRETKIYYSKLHIEKTKEACNFMKKNIGKHITIDEISNKFDISLTTLKNCFKEIYGSSMYSYLRLYRIQKAAGLLLKTNESITDIAGKIGYSNPSKFSAAFKEIMKNTPSKYRREKNNLSD